MNLDRVKVLRNIGSLNQVGQEVLGLSLLLIITVWLALRGEVIPALDQLGFDGTVYAKIIEDLPANLSDHSLSSFYVQRLFVPVLVKTALNLWHLRECAANIVLVMRWLNVAAVLCAALVWFRICRLERVTSTGAWLGFLFMFFNFATLKMYNYDPVLVDPVAFLLGCLSLSFYLRKAKLALFITSLISLVALPTAIFTGSILLLFGLEQPVRKNESESRAALVLPLAVALCFVLAAVIFYWGYGLFEIDWQKFPVQKSLLPISISAAAGYIFYIIRATLKSVDIGWTTAARLMKAVNSKSFIFVLCLVLTHLLLTKVVADPTLPTIFWTMAGEIFWHPTARPLQFIPAHFIYYGPAFLFYLLHYNDVARGAQNYGYGFLFTALIAGLFTIDAESRHFVTLLPFQAFCVAVTIRRVPDRKFLVSFTLLCLLLSRFWLPVNRFKSLALPSEWTVYPFSYERLFDFPSQLFFMNLGPYASNQVLLGCLLPMVLCSIYIVGAGWYSVSKNASNGCSLSCRREVDEVV